jgi:hypothetical protein
MKIIRRDPESASEASHVVRESTPKWHCGWWASPATLDETHDCRAKPCSRLRWYFIASLILAKVANGMWFNWFQEYMYQGANAWVDQKQMSGSGPRLWKNGEEIPLHAGLNNSVSSCLLIMDDNHRLTEWIAYHYYVMPLRHLVLSVDPGSRTLPTEIVERWKPYLTIEIWNDTESGNTTDHAKGHEDLVRRQVTFYKQCGLHLQSLNKTWTMFSDVDEFWSINQEFVPDWNSRMQQQGAILNLVEEIRNMDPSNKTAYQATDISVYQGKKTCPGDFERSESIQSYQSLV